MELTSCSVKFATGFGRKMPALAMRMSTAPKASTAGEDGQGERVLQQAVKRIGVVVAVDSDHSHEIGDDPDRRLRAEDFRVVRQLRAGGMAGVDRAARAPAQGARCFDQNSSR